MPRKPFFITTAIDYVNNLPHIGTAYEKIGADVLARFRRLEGDEVFFLMGNDEHSVNVKKEAQARGLDPQRYCDQMADAFLSIWGKLRISFDDFIRTTEARHAAAVQALFTKIHQAGNIYPGKYRGLYCDSCETFYREKDLPGGVCPQHGTQPRPLEEDNYFFALSRYAQPIRQAIEEGRIRILPDIRRNEILNLLDSGLEDISISRSTFDWGIPLPIEPRHVVYVWFDALVNYISAVGYGWDMDRFRRIWPADVHVIGKDITRFHCVIWPAMLLAAGLELPRMVFGHGFVYLKGEKMSKSLGNIVRPLEIVDVYGSDALRYYLLRETAFGADGNFTWENFTERFNRDLANDLGNLLQRVLTMIRRYRDGRIPAPSSLEEEDRALRDDCLGLYPEVRTCLDPGRGDLDFHVALARIWETVRHANQYVDHTGPWSLHKKGLDQRLNTVLYCAAECLRFLGAILYPFLPEGSGKLLARIGWAGRADPPCVEDLSAWGRLQAGNQVGSPEPLYPRISDSPGQNRQASHADKSDERVAGVSGGETREEISLNEFNRVDLRVARILEAERIPKTDKLLRLRLDMGKERTVVAGLGRAFEPADLVGRLVVVAANLKPTRIRGILSEGMVLAAGEGDSLALATVFGPAKPGDRLR